MVREVEDQAPHLFSPDEKPEIEEAGENAPVRPSAPEPKSEDLRAVALATTPLDTPTVELLDEATQSQDAAYVSPAAAASTPGSLVAKSDESSSKPTETRSKQKRPAGRKKASAIFEAAPLIDDLDMLEAENAELKVLLVKHLRAENSKLRKMLERFGVNQ
ncbi:hypothetical protein N185_16395 [Sinorhizobium sp. GW3]|nr:hypothetical protein N185_16395 [Sinorhizobium sp. GW3]